MAWIETVPPEAAEGRLARVYHSAVRRAGKVFGIVRLMSPDPRILEASMGLYASTTTAPDSPLPRWFRELVAVEVSRANACLY
ncbi:MAG: peroxidase [Planctomycetes bacterium]|nr:peroxidase [Planctomycetota bacterium]